MRIKSSYNGTFKGDYCRKRRRYTAYPRTVEVMESPEKKLTYLTLKYFKVFKMLIFGQFISLVASLLIC